MKPILYFTIFAYIFAKAGYVRSAPAASCQQKVSLVMPCVSNGETKLDVVHCNCPHCKGEVPILVRGKENFIAVISGSAPKPASGSKSSCDSKKPAKPKKSCKTKDSSSSSSSSSSEMLGEVMDQVIKATGGCKPKLKSKSKSRNENGQQVDEYVFTAYV